MAFWEEWVDVSDTDVINRYALFLGYLGMATRGLGFLVVTWTTVVLLGGFVSVLAKKDFWCLTVITLVQILGVFDFLFKEKASDIVNALMGLVAAVRAVIVRKEGTSIIVLSVVQMLGFAIALCPLVLLYLLGLYISTGISLWRLIEHDYGNIDGAPNLKPALNVLYSLAVAQGLVFSYKTMYDFIARTGVTERMAAPFKLDEDLVSGYLDQTVAGCIKDPSFAKGRNLITYAADLLMEPKSTNDYLSGVQILGTILQVNKPWWNKELALLTGSASFRHVIQRLLEILRPGSPYGTEIRKHAANAVVHVAECILLEQIPGGIQLMSTLLDTFEEYSWRCEVYNRGSPQEEEFERRYRMYMPDFLRLEEPLSDSNRRLHEYKWFVVQGLRILQKLAVHEGNCRVISHTGGLLSKAMAPLISEQLHRDVHDEWCSMAEESVELMRRLMAAPGETGEKLQLEISRNLEAAISSVKSFLECPKCSVLLKRHAVKVLLYLSVDTSSIMASGRRCMMFSWILLHIFVLPDDRFGMTYASMHWVKRSSHIRRLAGEKLLAMLSTQSEGSSTNMLQVFRVIFTSLTRTIVQAGNDAYRLHAAHTVNDLCYFYTEHDELYTKHDKFLEELKEAITNVMPEVLKKIFRRGSTSAELHERAQANMDQVSAQRTYIEGVVPQINCQDDASSSQWQNGEQYEAAEEVREALISLCGRMPHGWACQLDEIAAKTCSDQGIPVKDFRSLVQYADNLLKEEKAHRLANAPSSSFK